MYDPNNVCMHDENDAKNDEEDIIGNAVKKLLLNIPKERVIPATPKEVSPSFYFDYYSMNFESIPSALALYRLICMFEVSRIHPGNLTYLDAAPC